MSRNGGLSRGDPMSMKPLQTPFHGFRPPHTCRIRRPLSEVEFLVRISEGKPHLYQGLSSTIWLPFFSATFGLGLCYIREIPSSSTTLLTSRNGSAYFRRTISESKKSCVGRIRLVNIHRYDEEKILMVKQHPHVEISSEWLE